MPQRSRRSTSWSQIWLDVPTSACGVARASVGGEPEAGGELLDDRRPGRR